MYSFCGLPGNGHFIVQNLAGGAQGLTATITIPQQTFVQSQSGQHVANIAQVAAPVSGQFLLIVEMYMLAYFQKNCLL